MQALECGERFYYQDIHFSSIGLSILTAAFCNANRDPKGRAYRPTDFQPFREAYERFEPRLIPAPVCNTFWHLVKTNKLASWVPNVAPIDELRRGRHGDQLCDPMFWVSRGVCAIAPCISGDVVCIELLIVDEGVNGVVHLYDGLTLELQASIELPPQSGAYYVLEAEYPCLTAP
jgi:hypothetical protein